MNSYLFDSQKQASFQETQKNMGASIETMHLQAALVQKIQDVGQCEIM